MLWSLRLFTYIIDLLILTRRRCFFSGAGAFCGREAASGVIRSFSSALFEYYCFMRLSARRAGVIWKEKYINVKRF